MRVVGWLLCVVRIESVRQRLRDARSRRPRFNIPRAKDEQEAWREVVDRLCTGSAPRESGKQLGMSGDGFSRAGVLRAGEQRFVRAASQT